MTILHFIFGLGAIVIETFNRALNQVHRSHYSLNLLREYRKVRT